jgi:hypothetical protein
MDGVDLRSDSLVFLERCYQKSRSFTETDNQRMIETISDGAMVSADGSLTNEQIVLSDTVNTGSSPLKTLRASGVAGEFQILSDSGETLLALTDTGSNTSNAIGSIFVIGGISELGVFNAANYGLSSTNPNNAIALQAAISAAEANGGGTVFIPEGVYSIGSTISIAPSPPCSIDIVGATKATQITLSSTVLPLFSVANSAGTTFSRLTLTCPSSTSTNSYGIYCNDSAGLRFEDLEVTARVAYYLFDCTDITLFRSTGKGGASTNSVAGLWIDGGKTLAAGTTECSALECEFSGFPAGAAALLGHCQNVRFSQCYFLLSQHGVEVGNANVLSNPDRGTGGIPSLPGWNGIRTEFTSFFDCGFNQNTSSHCFYAHLPANTYGWALTHLSISGSHFESESASGLYFTLDSSLGAINSVQLSNITSLTCFNYGIWIQGGTNYSVTGGLFAGNGPGVEGSCAGIFIDGTAISPPSNVNISGTMTHQTSGSSGAVQVYGLQIAGSPSYLNVFGCDFSNNGTAAINFVPSATPTEVGISACLVSPVGAGFAIEGSVVSNTVSVFNCPGYNDQSTLLATVPPPSGEPVTSQTVGPIVYLGPMVIYSSLPATGTAVIYVGEGTHFPSTGLASGTFQLQPGETFKVTYTGDPPATFIAVGC